jgi:hypothetical protein
VSTQDLKGFHKTSKVLKTFEVWANITLKFTLMLTPRIWGKKNARCVYRFFAEKIQNQKALNMLTHQWQ